MGKDESVFVGEGVRDLRAAFNTQRAHLVHAHVTHIHTLHVDLYAPALEVLLVKDAHLRDRGEKRREREENEDQSIAVCALSSAIPNLLYFLPTNFSSDLNLARLKLLSLKMTTRNVSSAEGSIIYFHLKHLCKILQDMYYTLSICLNIPMQSVITSLGLTSFFYLISQ